MYAKLFSRITESSLMEEQIPVRYTFVMLLAIADPTGLVVGTEVALARRLNMPLGQFKKCVQTLQKPDPHSNSKEEDGRRLTPSEGERGYQIVNFVKYRDLRDEDARRSYMRSYMKDYRAGKHDVNTCKQLLTPLAQVDADADAPTEEDKKAAIDAQAKLIYQHYPLKVAPKVAIPAIIKAIRTHGFEHIEAKTKAYAVIRAGDKAYMPNPSTWFNQERFNDDPSTWTRENTRRPAAENPRNSGVTKTGPSYAEIFRRKEKEAMAGQVAKPPNGALPRPPEA